MDISMTAETEAGLFGRQKDFGRIYLKTASIETTVDAPIYAIALYS